MALDQNGYEKEEIDMDFSEERVLNDQVSYCITLLVNDWGIKNKEIIAALFYVGKAAVYNQNSLKISYYEKAREHLKKGLNLINSVINFRTIEYARDLNRKQHYDVIRIIASWELNFNIGSVVYHINEYSKSKSPKAELETAIKFLDYEIDNLRDNNKICF